MHRLFCCFFFLWNKIVALRENGGVVLPAEGTDEDSLRLTLTRGFSPSALGQVCWPPCDVLNGGHKAQAGSGDRDAPGHG